MKLITLFISAVAVTAAAETVIDLPSSTTVYIQTVSSPSEPVIALAEIRYDPSTLLAEIQSYEAPEISIESSLVRLGVYDLASKSWKTSTTVTSAETFAQGYSPTFFISLDAKGDVFSVICKSGAVDAGQTRNFAPMARVVKMTRGKQPELNKPVIISPEGKVAGEEPEKTLLQKYWWVGLAAVILMISSGGDK